MGVPTYTTPTIGEPNATEDIDVRDALTQIKSILNGNIDNDNVKSTAAIAFSKLASLTTGKIIVGTAGGTPTAVTLSGDATINAAGVLTLGSDVVGGENIGDDEIDSEHIVAGAIDEEHLAPGAVGSSKLSVNTDSDDQSGVLTASYVNLAAVTYPENGTYIVIASIHCDYSGTGWATTYGRLTFNGIPFFEKTHILDTDQSSGGFTWNWITPGTAAQDIVIQGKRVVGTGTPAVSYTSAQIILAQIG